MGASRAIVLVLVAACGDNAGSPIDAAPDAPALTGPHYQYVIDKLFLPHDNAESQQYGLDLDGDGQYDNQLGMVIATVGSLGTDPQPATDRAVDTGAAINLVDLQTPDLTTAAIAGVEGMRGSNPVPAACSDTSDTTCRHHLDGTATFDVSEPPAGAITGPLADGVLVAGPGVVTTTIPLLGAPPVVVRLLGSRLKLSATPTTISTGVWAGGIPADDVANKVIPALQFNVMMSVTTDCTDLASPPSCGCSNNSQGMQAITLFDTTPHDCAISIDEVRNNSLVRALLAPDITIDGQPVLSIGVGFTAVHATFTVPQE